MMKKMQTLITQDDFQRIAEKPLLTAEELFVPLNRFHSILYDAFGYSLTRTQRVLRKTHNKKSKIWFQPQAIRFYVHDFLSQEGVKARLVDEKDVVEDDEVPFDPRVLPSNGIAGNIEGFEYRVFKIFKGGLPPPVSLKRKEYYSQPHLKAYKLMLPGLANYVTNRPALKPNLIYIWEVVKKSINLYVVIPEHHLLYATTKLTLIPNPITTMKQTEVEEDIDVEKPYLTKVK